MTSNVTVKRVKGLDNYILLQTTLVISAEDQLILEKMPEEQEE